MMDGEQTMATSEQGRSVRDSSQSLTSTLILGLTSAVLLDTVGQLLWKGAVETLPPAQEIFPLVRAAMLQPLFLVVIAVFLLQLFNWLRVLDRADLSYAQPITSLSYITVAGLSALLFDEVIGLAKVAGIFCILIGVWIISQGSHQTLHTPETGP